MDTIERALRLLETQQAGLGTALAVVAVAVAVLVVVFRGRQGELRLAPALLIVGAAVLVGAGIVNLTYDAWYRHRCIDHHSDISECYAEGRRWGH